MLGISKYELEKLTLPLPSLAEQREIAGCLSSLDDLIEARKGQVAALKLHKRGLMQRLFPAPGETTPALRFPGFRDAPPWEVKRLGEVFVERNERNNPEGELLSVSLNSGVVRASEIGRKVSMTADRSNYKVVKIDDIAYNSMRMWQGASGCSKFNGIVSPAYTVVTPNAGEVSDFWAHYFKLKKVMFLFQRYSQGLTSDTWNLKFPAFSDIKLPVPTPAEQREIAGCLSSLNDLIEAREGQVATLKLYKRGLMQKLFPAPGETASGANP
ncbi:MAG: restriction endonuclease subunit S [Hyphomonadaceae bacterium]|nr:restriction endonuclease subunit S [Hyphomonadaceae bacterium]